MTVLSPAQQGQLTAHCNAALLCVWAIALHCALLCCLPSGAERGSSGGGAHFLSRERVDLVLSAIELCWLTCSTSPRNAEELLRAGGVPVLGQLLSR